MAIPWRPTDSLLSPTDIKTRPLILNSVISTHRPDSSHRIYYSFFYYLAELYLQKIEWSKQFHTADDGKGKRQWGYAAVYWSPKKTLWDTTTPLGRQARIFDLAHFYETFHVEADMPRRKQKSDLRLQRVFEAWRKDWKPQTDAATSSDCETLSFSISLEMNVVGWDQQHYGWEQQGAHKQLARLVQLLIWRHRIVRGGFTGWRPQHPKHTTDRSYLLRQDAIKGLLEARLQICNDLAPQLTLHLRPRGIHRAASDAIRNGSSLR